MKRRSSLNLTEDGVCVVYGDGCEWFLCLLGQCFEKSKPVWIKCSKNASSNATEHLETQHCIVSSKMIVQQLSRPLLVSLNHLGGFSTIRSWALTRHMPLYAWLAPYTVDLLAHMWVTKSPTYDFGVLPLVSGQCWDVDFHLWKSNL